MANGEEKDPIEAASDALGRMDAIARELKEFEQTVLLPAAEAAKVPK